MKKRIAALLFSALPFAAYAQTPDINAGKTLWEGGNTECRNCHGKLGEGAFGPDLAGRGLSAAQFQQAVRHPWGVMPAFVDTQLTDAELANIAAYFATLPKNPAPGPWRFPVDASAPHGQQMLEAVGCAQCHNPTFDFPRATLGGGNLDFETFKSLVYAHTDTMGKVDDELRGGPAPPPPPGRPARRLEMGNFNPMRVAESQLRDIYDWSKTGIGWRPLLQARLTASAPGAASYNLNLTNGGLAGKGMVAEGVTVELMIPAGATVSGATGDGYKGTHAGDGGATVAEWDVASLKPKDSKQFTITLSAPAAPGTLKGAVHWARPKPVPSDVVNIALAGGPPG